MCIGRGFQNFMDAGAPPPPSVWDVAGPQKQSSPHLLCYEVIESYCYHECTWEQIYSLFFQTTVTYLQDQVNTFFGTFFRLRSKHLVACQSTQNMTDSLFSNTQISTAVQGNGDFYGTAVPTTYCPRPKITPETFIFPEGSKFSGGSP